MPINEHDKPLFTLTRKVDTATQPTPEYMNLLIKALLDEAITRLAEAGYKRDADGYLKERFYPELSHDKENNEVRLVLYRSSNEEGEEHESH